MRTRRVEEWIIHTTAYVDPTAMHDYLLKKGGFLFYAPPQKMRGEKKSWRAINTHKFD